MQKMTSQYSPMKMATPSFSMSHRSVLSKFWAMMVFECLFTTCSKNSLTCALNKGRARREIKTPCGHFCPEILLKLILILKIGFARTVPNFVTITRSEKLFARSVPKKFSIIRRLLVARTVPNFIYITLLQQRRLSSGEDRKRPDIKRPRH